MDAHGVDQAVVVCAAIGTNSDNVEYISCARDRHPDRLHVFADLDCPWSTTYHRSGSADRLRALADRYALAGFTHYVERRNDGWLLSGEAAAVFKLAAERRLLVSLAAGPLGKPTCGLSRAGTRVSPCSATTWVVSEPAAI